MRVGGWFSVLQCRLVVGERVPGQLIGRSSGWVSLGKE
jgi:hypothetical protein